MGAVWSARDRRLRRDVAVKLLHAWIAEDLELRRRFAREARVLAPLEHENIVRLYDYGEDGETPFLVMELVEGANLGDVARNRVFSWAAGRRDRAPDRVRARLRACARDRAPRPHPGQRPDRACHRPRRRLRLRPRADRALDDQRHDPGHVARDTGVLVARAGPRRRQRDRHRHVRARLPALLAAVGAHPVRGRRPAGGRASARARDGAVAALLRAGRAAGGRGARRRPARAAIPADRPSAVAVGERLGAAAPSIRSAVVDTIEAAERPTAVFAEPLKTAVLEPPRRHSARKRRRGRRMALVAVGIAAAAALAFVGATIANADRVVEVPKVTGLTVQQARTALAEAAHVDRADAPLEIGSRSYSESVPAGRVITQSPAPLTRVERADLDLVLRVSLGTAHAPSCPTSRDRPERGHGSAAPHRVRRQRPHRGIVGDPRGPRHLERCRRRRRGDEARSDRHRRLERPSAGVGAGRARRRRRRRRRAARRELRHERRRGGLGDRPGRLGPAPVARSRHACRARVDGDAHGGARARVGDDLVGERQRLLRLGGHRGHRARRASGGSSSTCIRAT